MVGRTSLAGSPVSEVTLLLLGTGNFLQEQATQGEVGYLRLGFASVPVCQVTAHKSPEYDGRIDDRPARALK